ncbi:MAG: hypothetical protein L6R37_003810 [Teloschistes peruensis]|nr:MAG: hypothetical protein L6R37_003810 [Teloschistes peruensis]
MAPTLPGKSSLESIGSVAANFSRTDEEEEQADNIRFAYGCAESEFLLQVFEQAVHDDFIASVKAEKEKAAAEKRKRDEALAPTSTNQTLTSQRPPLPTTLSGSAAKPLSAHPHLGRSPASFDGSPLPALKPIQSHDSISSSGNPPRRPTMAPIATSHQPNTGDALEVGDAVNIPGGMHGTLKFIGEVRGKNGIFAGVELSREYAARGKNDGDVDGTRYFTTSIPGSGVFLPSNKAFKRASPTDSSASFPPTPTTPYLVAPNASNRVESNAQTPPTPLPNRFNKSVTSGRAASPAFRPTSRPSLPRPESPLRKAQNAISTPSGRPSIGKPNFSKSITGTPRYAPSPTPGKVGGTVRGVHGDPGKRPKLTSGSASVRGPKLGRPESRTQSRLGPEAMFDEEADAGAGATGFARAPNGASRPPLRPRRVSGYEDEIQALRDQLAERDKQLDEQAANLADMEKSVTQLQSTLPQSRPELVTRPSRSSGTEEADVAQLRALIREKNDKIAMLTADFDAHRADFRSTIDTLELASAETERVYERKVEDLAQEIRELQDRGEDVESVAQQLKQLEELVQELEEGLEDARRGEAEARGEVEFLRGEVERGRSELRRERDKAAAALKGAGAAVENGGSSREVEQRDDEIRGLKAIIHSLSRDAPDSGSPKPGGPWASRKRNSALNQTDGANEERLSEERQKREQLEREVQELEGLVDRKTYREEELENEIERLRTLNSQQTAPAATSNGHAISSPPSNHAPGRIGQEAMSKWHQSREQKQTAPPPDADSQSIVTDASNLWCEICETPGHDILTCTSMFTNDNGRARNGGGGTHQDSPTAQKTGKDAVKEGLRNLAVSSSPLNQQQHLDHHAYNNDNENDDRPAPLSLSPSPNNNKSATVTTPRQPMPNPMDTEMVAGKASGVIDKEKWCALCERDGHESVDCPFDDAY